MTPAGHATDDSPLLLGCDIGTSGVKTILSTAEGTLLARSVAEHAMHHPRPGWAENDPDDWYLGISRTIRDVLTATAVDPARVAALSVVCQREPVVLLDSGGRPVARSISWTDTRAGAEADEVAARFGRSWLIETTGMAPTHGMSLAHLLWLQRHRRDLWRSVRQIRFAKDYVLHRLAGCRTTDVTTPGRSSMLDIRRRQWSHDICDAFRIDQGMLPPIAEHPWEVAAELPGSVAAELGLPPGLPVAMGGADDASATLGCGAFLPGDVCVGTGTATNWRTVLAEYRPDHSARGDVSVHAVPSRFLHEVAIESTGSSLRWLRDAFAGPPAAPAALAAAGAQGFEQLVRSAETVSCGADGLFFFPFVDGAARAPRYASGARGAFLGVLSGHSRAHLVRAVLEGVAFQYRATMPILGSQDAWPGQDAGLPGQDAGQRGQDAGTVSLRSPIGIGDGEARSPLWTQIKADVLGVPLRVPRIADLAAAGAVILAGLAAGVFGDTAAGVRQIVRWERQYEPDPRRSAVYAELSAEYERVYQRIEQTFSQYRRPGQGDEITSGNIRGAQA
jgi:xylulokinase